jgi:hypothetical protein
MLSNITLCDQIISTLKSVHEGSHIGQRKWTTIFKDSLGKLVIGSNLIQYPNSKYGEWLVDLCWSEETENWQETFCGLKLACEIEWSTKIDNIIYDFQKLLVVNAEIKLFIYQYTKNEKREEINKKLFKAFSPFVKNSPEIIIAASGNNTKELYIYSLSKKGIILDPTFARNN